jgi:SAM-dependent methyltransferase
MTDLPEVRQQYEQLPYPPRDPADEKTRLCRTWLDDLPMISHYCFGGEQPFRAGFRVLVAGGGTGDATIFLAEQLRGTGAEIVHLDVSAASIAIARERARLRSLENITWVHDSLLALPSLGLGAFDYINCVGVLHHLPDPDAGLQALTKVMKDGGALGLMLYARYGRTAVYQMQELMRLICGDAELPARIAATQEVLKTAPPSNWFKRSEDLHRDHVEYGDAGIADLFLHPCDRAYSVEELYEWLCDRYGLHLQFTEVGRGVSRYLPSIVVGPQRPSFLAAVAEMPMRRQHAIAELLDGSIAMHCFYATRSANPAAPYGDAHYVPFLFHEPVTGPDLAALVERHKGQGFVLENSHTGMRLQLDPGQYSRHVLRYIDGRRTFRQIFDLVRVKRAGKSPPGDQALFDDFRPFYDALRAIDRILLRHEKTAPWNGR